MTIVGAGFVGRTTALRVLEDGLADVCLLDVIPGWAEGLALDLRHSAPIRRFDAAITGGGDYAAAEGSDVVVVAAGASRSPGMTRLDLLNKNKLVVEEIAGRVAEHCPESVVIVVTNPLDEMVYLFAKSSGFRKQRVVGMAGLLDSARFRSYIAEELRVSPLAVRAMTLGSHGDDMVPLSSRAEVNGRPLTDLVEEATLRDLERKTANAGAEIVGLLGKGSAFYAPSAAVAEMVRAVISGTGEVMPVCAWVQGQYGIRDAFLGVPVRLGRKGVEEIVEYDLPGRELTRLRAAADAIRSRCEAI